jgi:hypothetical protein
MPTVNAIIKKKVPYCPQCETPITKHQDYGVSDQGFWFSGTCPVCSDKKRKVKVQYFTDSQFNLTA